MEKIVELWYLNSLALAAPAVALIVAGYIWFAARQRRAPAGIWLAVGILSIALTLPAAWTTFNFKENDKLVLQRYLEERTKFSGQFGEDVTQAIETIAVQLGITEKIGVNYQNLQWFLYASLAGLAGSIISVIGYASTARQASVATVYSPPPMAPFTGQPTGSMYAPTQQPPMASWPPPTPPIESVAPAAHPLTEQIDVNRGGIAAGYRLAGQVGSSAPPKTELLNAAPTTVNAWFVVKEGARVGKLYHLAPEATTIGRDPGSCDILLDDTAISRQHIKVRQSKEKEQDVFTLHDLATANGTKVNGIEISKQVLQDGDEVALGRTVLVFKQLK